MFFADDVGASACLSHDSAEVLPQGEDALQVRWHKVQYACGRLCPRKAFTEQIGEVPAGPG